MTLASVEVAGPEGKWLVVSEDERIVYLGFPGESVHDVAKLLRLQPDVTISSQAVPERLQRAATALINGDSARLNPDEFRLHGTTFQLRVWTALQKIGWGHTCTYTELAAAIGQPTAVRAVAHAVATNPVPLTVPCHRVLPRSGGVGQYRGGSKLKTFLLSREGVNPVK